MSQVRVRFAPSPTGPLHIGGVRTALYNYLFAKKNGGTFILRVEDTDQNRYVQGAEKYIKDSLSWLGMALDEGPEKGGEYGPYRQSERKELYKKYAFELVEKGLAYYAFDTPEDLDLMRKTEEQKGNPGAKYNYLTRGSMKNSLNMSESDLQEMLDSGVPRTIRLKIPQDKTISFTDVVRGEVSFSSNELDDKIILKGDDMPTYHLANIVDDHLMKITHVIRGEEWLSSTAHHVLMYEFFGWDSPIFSHLPLILKPSGKGKLSKRDGAKFGFPVFPLEWHDATEGIFSGFREMGFLPDALLNFLAFLGWNPGTEQEMFSLNELVDAFSLDRIGKSGARFDIDKAKWFNQQYLIKMDNQDVAKAAKPYFEDAGISVEMQHLSSVCGLMKERIMTLDELPNASKFFFYKPEEYDEKTIRKRFKLENKPHFEAIAEILEKNVDFKAADLSEQVKTYVNDNSLKFGEILPVLRIALTGTLKGPDLFETIAILGKQESIQRIEQALNDFETVING